MQGKRVKKIHQHCKSYSKYSNPIWNTFLSMYVILSYFHLFYFLPVTAFVYSYIVVLKICLKISTQSFFTAYEPITEYFLDLIHTFFTLISTASTRHWWHYSGRSCKNLLIWLCLPYVACTLFLIEGRDGIDMRILSDRWPFQMA